jgi:hypothetical protein
MPCPKCGSHDLWDDNLAWGCLTCHWMSVDGTVRNNVHHNDKLNGQLDWPGKPKPPIQESPHSDRGRLER